MLDDIFRINHEANATLVASFEQLAQSTGGKMLERSFAGLQVLVEIITDATIRLVPVPNKIVAYTNCELVNAPCTRSQRWCPLPFDDRFARAAALLNWTSLLGERARGIKTSHMPRVNKRAFRQSLSVSAAMTAVVST